MVSPPNGPRGVFEKIIHDCSAVSHCRAVEEIGAVKSTLDEAHYGWFIVLFHLELPSVLQQLIVSTARPSIMYEHIAFP